MKREEREKPKLLRIEFGSKNDLDDAEKFSLNLSLELSLNYDTETCKSSVNLILNKSIMRKELLALSFKLEIDFKYTLPCITS